MSGRIGRDNKPHCGAVAVKAHVRFADVKALGAGRSQLFSETC